jgi:hypothetical protein
MAQAASRRPLTTEARVRTRIRPCEICGAQSGTGTGFADIGLIEEGLRQCFSTQTILRIG